MSRGGYAMTLTDTEIAIGYNLAGISPHTCPLCGEGQTPSLSNDGYYLAPHGRECILLYKETAEELTRDAEAWRVYVRRKATASAVRRRRKIEAERLGLK